MKNNVPKVLGKGSVELNFTSRKKLLLINMLHVPDICKNLVSANLLCKRGVKSVIESDKILLSKGGVFVGKGYSCDEIYKLSLNKNNSLLMLLELILVYGMIDYVILE